MNINFKNLGPIKNGKIDLTKKFYLFVGYNNSGKTYTSQLLWSIFNKKTIKNFSQITDIESYISNNTIRLTKKNLSNILTKFSSFLKTTILPSIFNLEENESILKEFDLEFDFSTNDFKDVYLESGAGVSMT